MTLLIEGCGSNLIVGGDFQDPQTNADIAGWTFIPNAISNPNFHTNGGFAYFSYESDYNDFIYQTIGTTVGSTYVATFSLQGDDIGSNHFDLYMNSGSSPVLSSPKISQTDIGTGSVSKTFHYTAVGTSTTIAAGGYTLAGSSLMLSNFM